MTSPDIPRQAQTDPEADARTRRINRLIGDTAFGIPLPRRIIDGPYTSHIEGHPELLPAPEIQASADDPSLSYTSNEDGHTIAYTDPKNPDANWSEHFPRAQISEPGNNQ